MEQHDSNLGPMFDPPLTEGKQKGKVGSGEPYSTDETFYCYPSMEGGSDGEV